MGIENMEGGQDGYENLSPVPVCPLDDPFADVTLTFPDGKTLFFPALQRPDTTDVSVQS